MPPSPALVLVGMWGLTPSCGVWVALASAYASSPCDLPNTLLHVLRDTILDQNRFNSEDLVKYTLGGNFWNGWGCTQEDLVFIVCGSATSWLVDNLLESTEGLYDRVTRVIDLQPFTLAECQEYYVWSGVEYSCRQVVESHMVFGGIPYYLSLQERGLSLAQNVEALLFRRGGQLVMEFDRLFATLFRNPEPYERVVRRLAARRGGMTRSELSSATRLGGNSLTKTLRKLEQCGFIRGFRDFTKRKKGTIFQLIDPFTLFWLTHVDRGQIDGWMGFVGTPGYYAWAGLSFELVCLLHIDEIKQALGVSGVQTSVSAWRSKETKPAAQIDLLIDRRDDVVNLCEMKYSDGPYALTATDERSIRNKMAAFRAESGTRKAIHPTLITLDGAGHNAHFNSVIVGEVTVGDWLEL